VKSEGRKSQPTLETESEVGASSTGSEYRPAHGNGHPTGKRVGKKKGTLSRHDIHSSFIISYKH